MVPGLGFLYSGLARRKSALSLMWACMISGSVITFQWYFWGFSLTFSASGTSGFIGDLKHFGLKGVLGAPSVGSPLIPNLLYAFYQVCLPLPFLSDTASKSYRCNSAQSQQPSLQAPLPKEVDSCHSASGFSSGLPSSITQLHAGHGIPMDGATYMVSSIMLVVDLSRFVLVYPHSPIPWSLANVKRR